eukprot:m.1638211 g.1638211  ORF g.1638211 m.1638211 type:complete len:561 (-) comp27282_c0_seq1:102-1784(-)
MMSRPLAIVLTVGVMLGNAVVYGSELKVMLKLNNLNKLERSFWDIATPGNKNYLQFLSRDDVASMIGAQQQDIDSTITWLSATLGVHHSDISVSPLRDAVVVSIDDGTATPAHHTLPSTVDFIIRKESHASLPAGTPQGNASGTDQKRFRGVDIGYSISDQKKAYGIPLDLEASNADTLQMVWGPGTFGYSKSELLAFKLEQCPKLNMDKIKFDTANHGTPGGDNFGEGNLDVSMITSFGLNVETIVSNTNTSSSTEEGEGFGQALLDFVTELATRDTLPQVLSISLGSLSSASCALLCSEAAKSGISHTECNDFLQQQRQVCMYLSDAQTARISTAFQTLGARGVSVFGSSGDGGSHWSFQPFPGGSKVGQVLNEVGCKFQFPVFPTGSPYVTSVGGTVWGSSSSDPIAWSGSGGGFSWQFARPPHQDAVVEAYLKTMEGLPPASSYNSSNRAYPDISAISVDGTSQSSPTTAGIFSLITDHRLNNGLKPLGFLGPRLYATMSKYPGSAFQDVTQGNTKTSCDNGFGATQGWDPVTGWGRPVWAGLLQHFGSDELVHTL